jgi:hypothetical protein
VIGVSNLALVSSTKITLAVCLAFVPAGIHVVWRSWTRLLEHRPHLDRKADTGEYQWYLMQPFGEA